MPPTFWERQWVFTTSAKSSDLAGNRRRSPAAWRSTGCPSRGRHATANQAGLGKPIDRTDTVEALSLDPRASSRSLTP